MMIRIKNIKGASPEQNNIYKGLSSISPEAAAFYRDAVLIMREDCLLETKSNLVAHLSREIDSTLRGIFAPKAMLPPRKPEPVVETQKQSITRALGFEDEKIATEWHKVASTFARFAHRSGKGVRLVEEFSDGWNRYEKVLGILSGSAYALSDRISHLTSYEEPTPEMLRSLKVMLEQPNFAFQFYVTLRQLGWLVPMQKDGFFTQSTFPSTGLDQDRSEEWLPLRYLQSISQQVAGEQAVMIREIVVALQDSVIDGSVKIDDYSIANILNILKGLADYEFADRDARMLEMHRDGRLTDNDFFEGEFMELLKQQLADGKVEGLVKMMVYAYGYSKTEVVVEGFDELGMNPMVRFYPNLSTSYRRVVNRLNPEITDLGRTKLMEEMVAVLEKQFGERAYESLYFPSVEWSEQSEFGMAEWEYELIQYIRDAAAQLSSEERGWLVERLTTSTCPACWRLGLSMIHNWFDELQGHFWNWIAQQPLDGGFPVHELYLVLRDRMADVDADKFSILSAWIEGVFYDNEQLTADHVEQLKNERIVRYLSAMRLADVELEEQRRALVAKHKKYDYQDPHPEFEGYTSVSTGYDVPVRPANFEQLPVSEQVAFLSKYPGEDRFDFIPLGLGTVMNNLIIGQPQKYIADLDELGKAPAPYLNQFIGSFVHVLRNGAIGDFWPLVAAFLKWIDGAEQDARGDFEDLGIGRFFYELAEQIRQFDFSNQDLEKLIDIAVGLMEKQGGIAIEQLERDVVTHSMNSSYHQLFQAATIFANLIDEGGSPKRVSPQLLDYLDKRISGEVERSVDFSIALGMYFPYLMAAERHWVEERMPKLFPEDDGISRRNMLMGMLTSNYRPTAKFVAFLGGQDVMSAMLDNFKEDSPALAKLSRLAIMELLSINRAAVDSPTSIIGQLISQGDQAQLANLIKNLKYSEGLPDETVLKVWKVILNRGLADQENLGGLITEVVDLVGILSRISPVAVDLIEKSILFFKPAKHGYSLVRSLLSLPSDSIVAATDLLLATWKQTQNPPFVTKELQELVDELYLSGQEAKADEICGYVSDRGIMGLKEVYDRNKRGKFHK